VSAISAASICRRRPPRLGATIGRRHLGSDADIAATLIGRDVHLEPPRAYGFFMVGAAPARWVVSKHKTSTYR